MSEDQPQYKPTKKSKEVKSGLYTLFCVIEFNKNERDFEVEDFIIETNTIPRVGEYIFYSFGEFGIVERKVRDICYIYGVGDIEIVLYLDTQFNPNSDNQAIANSDGTTIIANSKIAFLNALLDKQEKLLR